MNKTLTSGEHLFLLALFGGIFLYCLFGASTGDLYVPGRTGPGIHLCGPHAWLLTIAWPLLYLSILLRYRFMELGHKVRATLEAGLLVLALAASIVPLTSAEPSCGQSLGRNQQQAL